MWTYLLIFLAALTIVAVFVRKVMQQSKAQEIISKASQKDAKAKEEGRETEKQEGVEKPKQKKAEALFRKGEEKLKAGKEDEAIKFFVQALSEDAGHTETKNKLAMLYLQKKMFSAASVLFRELAEEDENAVHYSHLGLALFQQNEFEEAKKAYQSAVSLDDSRPQRFVSLSQVYKSLGELQNALIAMNKAIDLDQDNPDYLSLLAEIQIEIKDLDGAIAVIEKIEILSPEHEHLELLKRDLEKFKEVKVEEK